MPLTKAEFDAWVTDVDAAFDALGTTQSALSSTLAGEDPLAEDIVSDMADVELQSRVIYDRMLYYLSAYRSPQDIVRPSVASTSPADGATGIGASVTVTVTFDEEMNGDTLTADRVRVLDSDGNPVAQASAPTLDGTLKIATLHLADVFASGVYRIEVSEEVMDRAANYLSQPFIHATGFTVAA